MALKLRRLREARGESMAIAAIVRKKYGVSLDSSYLSRMERGKAEIPLRTLYALCLHYEITPEEIMRETWGPADSSLAYRALVLADESLGGHFADLVRIYGPESAARVLFSLVRTAKELFNEIDRS